MDGIMNPSNKKVAHRVILFTTLIPVRKPPALLVRIHQAPPFRNYREAVK
jgi:hypothetical protein